MKGSVMSAIHHLRAAIEYMDDFVRESNKKSGGSRGAAKFGEYSKKMQWILLDMRTYPHFCDEVREGFRKEMESDVFAYVAIAEKCSLLDPKQREMLDNLLDNILDGETIEIQIERVEVQENDNVCE
jgi:hypothetical protein